MRRDEACNRTDSVLVERLSAGDQYALAELYDRFSPLVFGVARRVTLDSSVAEDICQEVFVHAWQHPDRFDPDRGAIRVWLGMLAHRRAVDCVRSHSRARAREQRVHRLTNGGQTEIADIVDDVAAKDVAVLTRRAVAQLPADQQKAVTLAYFGGHTYREVAELLGIPEGTAKSRLRLALARLADLLPSETPQWI